MYNIAKVQNPIKKTGTLNQFYCYQFSYTMYNVLKKGKGFKNLRMQLFNKQINANRLPVLLLFFEIKFKFVIIVMN